MDYERLRCELRLFQAGGANVVYEWSSMGRAGVERLLKVEADERAAKAAKRAAAKKKN